MFFHGKRYNFFGDYLSDKFGCRVLKLPVNAALSCPNRDGTLDDKGCIFCSEDGSASFSADSSLSISTQLKNAESSFKRGNSKVKYIIYFQAYTNTYGSPAILKNLYDEALNSNFDIAGLMIGTRPDCITDEIINVIKPYSYLYSEVWIELGIQSAIDKSLILLNRHHTFNDSINAVKMIKKAGIKTSGHFIAGIPGESYMDIIDSARRFSDLELDGIKLHHFHIIKNTAAEILYRSGGMNLLSMEEYISLICDILENINPSITIHRLAADRDQESLVAPKWGLHKGTVQNGIDYELSRRGTWQGFLYERGM